MSTTELVIVGGMYQHYTGDRYKVLHIASHGETDERMVVYQNVSNREVYVRPRSKFTDRLCVDTYGVMSEYVPRFKRVD